MIISLANPALINVFLPSIHYRKKKKKKLAVTEYIYQFGYEN
jgi:hypothetical protein